MSFVCTDCKDQKETSGTCDNCKKEPKNACGVCAEEKSECVCTGDIPQSKGTAKH